MVISYVYKIQWLFDVRGNFIETKEKQQKRLFNTIKCLGSRSLTKIIFLDNNYKRIETYYDMVSFPLETSDKETIKYIKKMLKTNTNVKYIEFIRI